MLLINRLLFVIFLLVSHFAVVMPASAEKQVDEIIVATHIEPPLIHIVDGKFVGQNVEVARLLASKINKKVRFVQCPFARCLAMMEEGRADMMVAIRKTAARQEFLSYLTQPFSSHILPVRFFQQKNATQHIASYDDIKTLNIGVLRGATFFDRFDKDDSLKKIEVTNHNQLIHLLLKGRIDTFLGREISIKARTKQSIYQHDLKMAPYIYSKKVDAYIAVSKKSPLDDSVELLSNHLDKLLADGALDKLLVK